MIEIKQSRKLHESGYRFMEVSYNDEILSSSADVLHIGFKDLFDGLHLDITKKGIIRIWSDDYELIPDKKFTCSDVVIRIGNERKMTDKEQINDSLKNSDKNFNENLAHKKEQIMIDTNKYFLEVVDEGEGTVDYTVVQPEKLLRDIIKQNKQLTSKIQEYEKYKKLAADFKDVNKQLGYKYLTIKDECEELKKECEEHKSNAESYCNSYQSSCEVNREITHKMFKYKQALSDVEKELKELKRQYKLSCLDCEYKNTKADVERYRKERDFWKHQAELGSETTDRLAKQLEEKEQECEELKDYAKRQENQRETYYKEFLKKDKALEEIEKYCNNVLSFTAVRTTESDILDIINKAKDGNNE